MVDAVGLIKIDEHDVTRNRYHAACLRSLDFLKGCGEVIIYNGHVEQYGDAYMALLKQCKSEFVMFYSEDTFMMLDDREELFAMLTEMKRFGCDVMKACFHTIEQNSVANVKGKIVTPHGTIFQNDESNHKLFQSAYGSRYYFGVNCITTRSFAEKIWNRKLGHRPHPYELARYSKEFEYKAYVPHKEVLVSIDDPHGHDGSHLLARHEEKFEEIYKELLNDKIIPHS